MDVVRHRRSGFVVRDIGEWWSVVRRWSDFGPPACSRPSLIHFLKLVNQILWESANWDTRLLQLNMSVDSLVFVSQAIHDSRSLGVYQANGARCFAGFSYRTRFQRGVHGAASQINFVRVFWTQLFDSAEFTVISTFPLTPRESKWL